MNTPMTTPRETPQYSSKSSRELYHPAIQDFSNQSKPPAPRTDEDGIFRLYLNGSVTPDNYHADNGTTPDICIPRYNRVSSNRQMVLPPATPISLPPATPNSFPPPKVAFYAENDYKYRIRLKAQNRYKLHPVKGEKTLNLDSCLPAFPPGRSVKRAPHTTDVESLKLDVTNKNQPTPDIYKEKRTPLKRHSPFSSVLKSRRLYTVEAYDDEPKKTHPVFKHKYSKWLTAGLKIQSLKIHDSRVNNVKKSAINDLHENIAMEVENIANDMNGKNSS